MSAFIPDPVVKRLPMYYRYLLSLERNHRVFVSSAELAQLTGSTASQVRQDISSFGGAGRQGCGYPVAEMREYIGRLLGKDAQRKLVIVGMGNMGRALVGYEGFVCEGYQTVACFDVNEDKTGQQVGSFTVRHVREMQSILTKIQAAVAVLTVPSAEAQKIAEQLYQCGIRGFWNFASVDLHLPADASIVSVHLDESLELLSYRLTHPGEQ